MKNIKLHWKLIPLRRDFDMVICNLYPFVEASKTDDLEKMIENIDIGGLSLIRAAAKNYKKGDLHLHTKESDGLNTTEEMVNAALEKRYEYIAMQHQSLHR